jgi:mono/diheme cytochrome c family protein
VRRFGKKATAFAAVSVGILLASNTGCSRRERSTVNPEGTYLRACARCHGERGQGGAVSSEGPAPRNFTDADWQESFSDAQIAETVRRGKGPMPSFDSVLSVEEIEAVTAAVRSFGGGLE